MIEKAIEKIKEEMEKNKAPYIQAIGNYILTNVEINIESAKKIVDGELTLKVALAEVKKVAKTKAVGNCAVLTDSEVYEIVNKYYEFNAIQNNKIPSVDAGEKKPKEDTKKRFSVDLNSLLKR